MPRAFAIVLAGCTFQPPGPIAPDDEDTDVVVECETTLTPFPRSGDTGVYPRTTVEALFTPEPEPSARLEVDRVVGTTAWRGDTLVFTPSRPMRPSTEHTVRATWDCAPDGVTWTFTTSEVGPPIDGPSLAGRAYVADLAAGRWHEPAWGWALTGAEAEIVVAISFADDSALGLAMSSEIRPAGVQDACDAAVPMPLAPFDENPFVDAGPTTATVLWDFGLFDAPVPLANIRVTGSFAPDLGRIEGVTLIGEMLLQGIRGNEEAACDALADIGAACGPCSDGISGECVPFHVVGLTATALPPDGPACSGG